MAFVSGLGGRVVCSSLYADGVKRNSAAPSAPRVAGASSRTVLRMASASSSEGTNWGDSSQQPDDDANEFSSNMSSHNCPSSRFWSSEQVRNWPKGMVDWELEWREFVRSGMRSKAGKGIRPLPPALLNMRKALRELRHADFRKMVEAGAEDPRVWAAVVFSCLFIAAFVTSHTPLEAGHI